MPENNRLVSFMQGRNGSDDLSRCSAALATIFVLINCFAHHRILDVLALVFLALAIVRVLLPASAARTRENERFLALFNASAANKSQPAANDELWEEDGFDDDNAFDTEAADAATTNDYTPAPEAAQKVYAHLECPECHQQMRVPTGMGRVLVTCPTCGNKFESES